MIRRRAFAKAICILGTVLVMMLLFAVTSFSQETSDDVVILKNGKFFIGRITAMEARCRAIPDIGVFTSDSVVTIKTLDGTVKTIPWSQVDRLATYEETKVVPKKKSYMWTIGDCPCTKDYGNWLLELRGGVYFTRDRDSSQNKFYPAGEAMLSYFVSPRLFSVGIGAGVTSIRDDLRFPVYVHLRATFTGTCVVPYFFGDIGLPIDKFVFNKDYSDVVSIGKNYWLAGIGGGIDFALDKAWDLSVDLGYRYYTLGEESPAPVCTAGAAVPGTSLRFVDVHAVFLRVGLTFEL
jgi:hypothetical protein